MGGHPRVIGAGLPRTGTSSLKAGLEQLLDGPCYHMFELGQRREADGVRWVQALRGDRAELEAVLDGWAGAVDWPASILWREMAEQFPDATVVLSHRGSADAWWTSADVTVWEAMRRTEAGDDDVLRSFNRLMRRAASLPQEGWDDPAIAKAWYEQHYRDVVDVIPAERLVIWEPTDGWEPLCTALNLPVPEVPFGHHNSTADFRAQAGFD